MVLGRNARRDVDRVILRNFKVITYRRRSSVIIDSSRDIKEDSFTDYDIKAQYTVNSASSQFDSEGLLVSGNLNIFLRWEYDFDVHGNPISPKLVPRRNDRILALGREWFTQRWTPVLGEDDVVIGWEANLSMVSDDAWIVK